MHAGKPDVGNTPSRRGHLSAAHRDLVADAPLSHGRGLVQRCGPAADSQQGRVAGYRPGNKQRSSATVPASVGAARRWGHDTIFLFSSDPYLTSFCQDKMTRLVLA